MKNSSITSYIVHLTLVLFFLLVGCQNGLLDELNDLSITVDGDNFDEYASAQPKLTFENIIDGTTLIAERQEEINDTIFCTETTYAYALNLTEFTLMDPTPDIMFIGNLILAGSLGDGSYIPVSIGKGVYAPRTFSLSSTNVGQVEATVDDPKLSTTRAAIQKLLSQAIIGSTSANINWNFTKIYSFEQLQVALKANYKNRWVDLKNAFDFDRADKTTRILLNFTQIYYSLDLNYPDRPSDYFSVLPATEVLGQYSPVYVSSIKYGRQVFLAIESSKSEQEVKNAFDGAVEVLSHKGVLDLDVEKKKIIEEANMSVFILGGSGESAVKSISGDLSALTDYIVEGGNFSMESPGVPLSYTLRYLKDNSLSDIVLSTEYTVRSCETEQTNLYTMKSDPQEEFVYCVFHSKGDRNFGRKDVEVSGSIEVEAKGPAKRDIYAKVNLLLREIKEIDSDGSIFYGDTEGEVSEEVFVGSIPSGKEFVRFNGKTEENIYHIDETSGSIDQIALQSESFLKELLVNAKGRRDDLFKPEDADQCQVSIKESPNNDSNVRFRLNDIKIQVRDK